MENVCDITLQDMIDQAGMKQRDIAELLKLHESTVSLKLCGKRKMSLEEATIIAERLNTTVEQIWHTINFALCKVSDD